MVSQVKSGDSVSNKAEILRAATAAFMEGGIGAITVRAVAARAGVSTIGVYSHFKGKTGLLNALYADGFDRLGAVIMQEQAGTSVMAALQLTVGHYLDFAERNPSHYKLMFSNDENQLLPNAAAQAAATSAFGKLAQKIGSAIADGDDSQKWNDAYELWALVHGLVMLRHYLPKAMQLRECWRAMVHSAVETHLQGRSHSSSE